MANLTISEKTARELYSKASDDVKTILTETFGEKIFSVKITDRIKSWEDVFADQFGDQDSTSFTGTKDEIAYKKLKAIAKCLNEGWEPDWKNSNQYKWYPWFYMTTTSSSPSGFGLLAVAYDYSLSYVSSRLCFKSQELAKYAATTFEAIYKDFFTI